MPRGLPRSPWDVAGAASPGALLGEAETGRPPKGGPDGPRRPPNPVAPGPPPARPPSLSLPEKQAATPFLARWSGSGDDDRPRVCSAARPRPDADSRNAPAVPSRPASPRQWQSARRGDRGRLAATRTGSAGNLPYDSLVSAWPLNARRLRLVMAVEFAYRSPFAS